MLTSGWSVVSFYTALLLLLTCHQCVYGNGIFNCNTPQYTIDDIRNCSVDVTNPEFFEPYLPRTINDTAWFIIASFVIDGSTVIESPIPVATNQVINLTIISVAYDENNTEADTCIVTLLISKPFNFSTCGDYGGECGTEPPYECICPPGTSGEYCCYGSNDIDSAYPMCGGNGQCDIGGVCECDTGYSGMYCCPTLVGDDGPCSGVDYGCCTVFGNCTCIDPLTIDPYCIPYNASGISSTGGDTGGDDTDSTIGGTGDITGGNDTDSTGDTAVDNDDETSSTSFQWIPLVSAIGGVAVVFGVLYYCYLYQAAPPVSQSVYYAPVYPSGRPHHYHHHPKQHQYEMQPLTSAASTTNEHWKYSSITEGIWPSDNVEQSS